jgi:acyl-coenzyme A synthetase/AMP-(fatty) acid ligase
MYGQTEATARISILPSSALPEKLGSVGVPVPGGKVEIESDNELTTVAGRAGELVYSGPNVMMGYAETRADLGLGDQLGGILRTGDMAYLDADGFIHITGRAKRDVKLFGLRVNLDEIENLMRVRGPAAAVSKNEGVRVYCEYGDAESLEECRRELAQKLGINYRAFEFERIDKLPTTANGKIDYQNLASRP